MSFLSRIPLLFQMIMLQGDEYFVSAQALELSSWCLSPFYSHKAVAFSGETTAEGFSLGGLSEEEKYL